MANTDALDYLTNRDTADEHADPRPARLPSMMLVDGPLPFDAWLQAQGPDAAGLWEEYRRLDTAVMQAYHDYYQQRTPASRATFAQAEQRRAQLQPWYDAAWRAYQLYDGLYPRVYHMETP